MARLNNPKAQQRKVDDWNARYPVGQAVNVRIDGGGTVQTKTRSPAELMSGHSAVIWLEGVSGCYLLSHVTAVEREAARG